MRKKNDIQESWGRLPYKASHIEKFYSRNEFLEDVCRSAPGLPVGLGRSYGDVGLNPGGDVWSLSFLSKFVDFDNSTGMLTCGAGVSLGEIQSIFHRRGWMLPISAGTQFVSIGGAIANDIHGKNHHDRGSFGNCLISLSLLRSDGQIIDCGLDRNVDWFQATIGGLGLTGIILEAKIQLVPVKGPWFDTENIVFNDYSEFFELADYSTSEWEYTVAWVDCLSVKGRGIFMRANHSKSSGPEVGAGKKLVFPFVPAVSLINRWTLPLLNKLYFHLNKANSGARSVHYQSYLYPLDSIRRWNRVYGSKGFYQYQCVFPRNEGLIVLRRLMAEIKSSGSGSCLVVLKTFGNVKPLGMLSFPRPGVTLALDFPNDGEPVQKLFRRLNEIVIEAGGAIYLAKDALLSKQEFKVMYPQHENFLNFHDRLHSSGMSRRLLGV